MMKYNIPTMKIASFLSENIVTESGVNKEYIQEVETLMGKMTPQEYKARVESVTNLLQFKQ